MKLRSDKEIFDLTYSGGYLGGGYYNPINEFIRLAKPLNSNGIDHLLARFHHLEVDNDDNPTYYVAELFRELTLICERDELIFALYDKIGRYDFAVWITNEERLMDFEIQTKSGYITLCGFFTLPRNLAWEGVSRDFDPTNTGATPKTYSKSTLQC